MKREQNEEIFKETLKFFVSNSAHIEVVRNNQLEKVHFYKLPHCHYLPDETKLEFHDTVSRDSVNAKISDLVDESQKIIEICKHEEELALFFSHNKFIAIFANYVILWKDLAFLLTLLLNIFIILSFYSGEPG
jgi:inositol 1,4,5-triphosphate receptor type 1/inositol 1,4,5-triphosphate receptor type 3